MPYVVRGNASSQRPKFKKKFDYDYPEGLKLQPGSKLHNQLRDEIWFRASQAHAKISERFDSWNEIDRTLQAYIPADDAEKLIKEKDSRKPVSVVMPYSYAMLETILTYLVMAFFQDPIFTYEGVGPEDTLGAIKLTHVIRLHALRNKMELALHTQFRDALAYGIGIGAVGWERRMGKRIIEGEPDISGDLEGNIISQRRKKTLIDAMVYEGNSYNPVDPYRFLPDPNVSSHEVQRGEFVGWLSRTNYMELLSQERTDEELFNIKYLRSLSNFNSSLSPDNSDREIKTSERRGDANTDSTDLTQEVDVIWMYVTLIPAEWELGKSEYPEKWLFGLAADEIIIKAQPLGLAHDMYPVGLMAPDFDGYSSSPLSRLELMNGLQGVLDFLFNSHITNVRKAINDMFVVDPYLVNIEDMKDPQPGKLIRIRRPAWGRGVENAIKQLSVADITRTNIGDAQFIMQMMGQTGASNDAMMGLLRQGGPERLTKAEFQGTQAGGISRLGRIARVIGLQCMQDIARMFASQAQQLMDQETYAKVIGEYEQRLNADFGIAPQQGRIPISPFDLLIDYDVVPKDGTIPGGNFSDVWVQLFQIIGSNELLIQKFDMFRFFKFIANQMGVKNIEDFEMKVAQPQVIPNATAAQGAQAGNLVPLGGLR